MLNILPVQTADQQNQFLSLPRQLYQNDPNWVPHLPAADSGLAGFTPPAFYETAEAQAFLAMDNR